jgi:FkbM family methyltransferase
MPNGGQETDFSNPKSGLNLTERVPWTPKPRESDPILSYSQNAEDVRLWRVFRQVEHGFYVDIGAGDPVEYSLTKLFYDRGWSGINIEPGPAFSALEAHRTRDVNLRLAVAHEEGVRDFWISSPHSGISTFYPAASLDVLPDGFAYDQVTVECMPAWRILEKHAGGRSIDFMTIDVEGAEADVIRSINFETTRPTVLVVEAITPLTMEPSHEAWEPIVLEADYVLAAFDGLNRFYVDSARQDVIPALAYPISVLDGFVPTALRESQVELEVQQAEIQSLRQRTSEVQSELAAVYASRIWRAGIAIATAANPVLSTAQRLRRLKRVQPTDVYAAAVAPRQAWHFPRGGAARGGLFDGLIRAFGPIDSAVTASRASDLANELNRIDWTDEDSLLGKRLSWVERQAVVEADSIIRFAGAPGITPTRGERSIASKGSRPVVVVDARCLQDPAYRQRGVGLHSRFVLDATQASADPHALVLLTTAELPPLDADVAAIADRIITTPYALRDTDVALFVELSPMTASIAPTMPFLAAQDCKSISLVYDFIPSQFPRAYLKTPAALLTNRVRVEALRHYDLLLPISEATAADCRRILGETANIRVTGVGDPLENVTPTVLEVQRPFMLVPIGGDPRKNPAAAIAALGRHRQATGAPLRAVVTGRLTGGQEAALRKLTRRLALPDEVVELRGNVSNDELGNLYESAELVFVPSFAEGFSIPVAEAVLRNAPVVASDIPPHRELVGSGPWLADPADVESLAEALAYVSRNRESVTERQRNTLGDTSHAPSVSGRLGSALNELSYQRRVRTSPVMRSSGRPRLALISPFPPQRSGVADYSAFTFGHVSEYADVEVYSAAPSGTSTSLPIHPLSAAPYLDGRFDAVINVIGNSHFHFPILDLMGSYGGACIAHDNRMVEAYRHDRGDAWTAELLSMPSRTVYPEELLDLLADLDRLPSLGYDIIARQASPLIVHGRTLADSIFHETATSPVVVPFVPYNIPRVTVIDDEARARARQALGLAADVLQIGTFGIVDRRTKGLDLIVAAIAWLRSWDIRAELHIVGQAPLVERHALRRLARSLGIDGEIVLHGHAPRAVLEDFLLGVDVAVQLRSSARLSLSGTLADCIAFGVPTVTTEIIAEELDAPPFVATCPTITSSLLIAEAILSLRDLRRKDTAAIDSERRNYLSRRSADGYARALLAALGLWSA